MNSIIEKTLKQSLLRLIKAKVNRLDCIVKFERQIIIDIGKKYNIK